MAERRVLVSDFSDSTIPTDKAVVLTVLDHPDLPGQPVRLDVLPGEVDELKKSAKSFVLVEVRQGDQAPQRYALDQSDFDKASERPMAEVLRQAPTAVEEAPRRRGRPRGSTSAAPRAGAARDYDIVALKKWADSRGKSYPQRGRIPQSLVDEYKAAGN